MALRLLAVIFVVAALLVPAACAHTAAFSVDGRVRASVGLLNEPVVTYKDTGLDICFTYNMTSPRTPLTTVNPGALTVTLMAPGGETMTQPLEGQFGRPGCFTFEHPLVLTQAGVYKMDMTGEINGTRFDVKDQVVGSTEGIGERGSVTWPDEDVPTNLELQQEIAGLRSEMAAMKADDGEESNGIPSPAAALLMIGLVGLAAVLRRR